MGRFTERMRRTLTGEGPSKDDIEKRAAEELKQAGTRPGAPPGSPGGPPLPVKPSPASRSDSTPAEPSEPPAAPAPPPPRPGRPTPEPPPAPAPTPPTAPPASGPPPTAPVGGFAAPSTEGSSLTPEEERRTLNDMALEDLGGPAADGGGLQVDPAQAEAMRDRALAQYLERKKALERERERKTARQAEEAEYEPWPSDGGTTSAEEAAERLAEVPGLGPAKIDALLAEFESFEAVSEADEDELVQVNGIGRRLAAEIVATLR